MPESMIAAICGSCAANSESWIAERWTMTKRRLDRLSQQRARDRRPAQADAGVRLPGEGDR
jgi:hypothetical protein